MKVSKKFQKKFQKRQKYIFGYKKCFIIAEIIFSLLKIWSFGPSKKGPTKLRSVKLRPIKCYDIICTVYCSSPNNCSRVVFPPIDDYFLSYIIYVNIVKTYPNNLITVLGWKKIQILVLSLLLSSPKRWCDENEF